MKELLDFILKNITGNTDYEITEEAEGDKVTFYVKVKSEDMGLVIGKGGNTIKSIQTLLRVRSRLDKKIVFVNISEKEEVPQLNK